MAQGQTLLTGHADITFKYDTSSGQWQTSYRHAGTFDDPDTDTALDQASLAAEDQPFNAGDRYNAPSGFEFTGASAGDSLWILPQTNRGYTWPGFRTEADTGTFSGSVKIVLQNVTYAGFSAEPVDFSVWQFQGVSIVQMKTSDGIDSTDFVSLGQNDHSHHNFGFTALGIYRVGFQASGTLSGTGEAVTSDTEYVTFAIGTLATWLADHYSGLDLVDDQVTGSESDSDEDRVKLIEEYAFNMNPTVSDRHVLDRDSGTSGLPIGWIDESQGANRLHLQMVRRKAATNPQIQYVIEFNDNLADDEGWVVASASNTQSIDATWERVTVIDSESTATKPRRFARVRIVIQEGRYCTNRNFLQKSIMCCQYQ